MNLNLFVPELTLAGFIIAVILLDMFVRQASILRAVALIGLIASGALSVAMWNNGNNPIFANMLAVDNFAVFFKVLFMGIAFLVILSSADYAVFASSSRVESFSISPSLISPQWPWLVYSSRQTSQITSRSGRLFFTARTARWTMPSGA